MHDLQTIPCVQSYIATTKAGSKASVFIYGNTQTFFFQMLFEFLVYLGSLINGGFFLTTLYIYSFAEIILKRFLVFCPAINTIITSSLTMCTRSSNKKQHFHLKMSINSYLRIFSKHFRILTKYY